MMQALYTKYDIRVFLRSGGCVAALFCVFCLRWPRFLGKTNNTVNIFEEKKNEADKKNLAFHFVGSRGAVRPEFSSGLR